MSSEILFSNTERNYVKNQRNVDRRKKKNFLFLYHEAWERSWYKNELNKEGMLTFHKSKKYLVF